MSNSNREELGYGVESSWGVHPGGVKKIINMLSNTLSPKNETTQSNTIRADTNRLLPVRTGIGLGGALPFEFQYGQSDDLLAGALRSSFPTAFDLTAGTISAASGDNSFNDSGAGLAGAVAGGWLITSGFSNAANNGVFKIVSVTTSKIVVSGGTLVTESAAAGRRLRGTTMKNSTTDKSFTFERKFSDHAVVSYSTQSGLRVGELSISVPLTGIVTGSVTLVGGTATSPFSTTSGFSSTSAASSTEFFNSSDNIQNVFVNGVAVTTDVTGFDFSISTNAEALRKVGSLYATKVSTGSISVTGSYSEYFADLVRATQSSSFDTVSIAFQFQDAAGNGYIVDFPAAKVSLDNVDNQGIDSQIEAKYNLLPAYSSSLACTILVTRYAA